MAGLIDEYVWQASWFGAVVLGRDNLQVGRADSKEKR